MSIASLSKFTVPLASGQSSSTQGMLMPKLGYRFRILFENFGVSGSTTELTKQVQKAARPNVEFADQTIEIYNSNGQQIMVQNKGDNMIRIQDNGVYIVKAQSAQQTRIQKIIVF